MRRCRASGFEGVHTPRSGQERPSPTKPKSWGRTAVRDTRQSGYGIPQRMGRPLVHNVLDVVNGCAIWWCFLVLDMHSVNLEDQPHRKCLSLVCGAASSAFTTNSREPQMGVPVSPRVEKQLVALDALRGKAHRVADTHSRMARAYRIRSCGCPDCSL